MSKMKDIKNRWLFIIVSTMTIAGLFLSLSCKYAYAEKTREYSLPLVLIGTIIEKDPAKSIAVIKNRDAKQHKTYKVNDEISGYKIIKIVRGRVALLKNGNILNLDFPLGGNADPITAISQNERIINRNALAKKIPDINAALRKATPIPHIEAGKIKGLKVTNLKDKAMAEAAGIKEGDIITSINGHKLNSLKEALDLYYNERKQDRFNVEIQRGKNIENLIYYVN